MEDFVWSCLRHLHGIERDDPSTWHVEAPWCGLKDYRDAPLLQSIGSAQLCGVIDEILGAGNWKKPRNWGGFLVKFPETDASNWNIPAGYWHVDAHFTYDPRTAFGLRVFTFLSDVPPRGGGTLVVAGSHRLAARFVRRLSAQERALGFAKLRDRFLSEDPWFRRLTETHDQKDDRTGYFMNKESVVDGVPVRVEQLCGHRGDVIIMHPWAVHAASPHCGITPRFMLAKDLFAESPREDTDSDHAMPGSCCAGPP
jgi:hypothetical protein